MGLLASPVRDQPRWNYSDSWVTQPQGQETTEFGVSQVSDNCCYHFNISRFKKVYLSSVYHVLLIASFPLRNHGQYICHFKYHYLIWSISSLLLSNVHVSQNTWKKKTLLKFRGFICKVFDGILKQTIHKYILDCHMQWNLIDRQKRST